MIDRCVTHYARNIIANKFVDGAEEHWGEYLLWIDSDQVFDPESLNEMIRTMNEYPEIDILGALIFKRVYPHTPTFYKISKFDKDKYDLYSVLQNSVVECDAIGCFSYSKKCIC
jgi:GT2 family glycosyltransferase